MKPLVAFNAHFLDRPWTGTGQYSARLVEWLGRAALPVDVTPIPGGTGGAIGKLLFEQWSVVLAAQRLQASLLHVPYLGPPFFQPTRTVVTVHDLIMLVLPEHRGPALYRLYTAFALAGARKARLVFADSEATRRDLVSVASIPNDRIKVIPLGRDERLGPVTERSVVAAVRAKYGLPDQFALYLGGFDSRKNVDLLLRAVGRTSGNWPLAIAGSVPRPRPPLYPDLESAARGLGQRVRWIGRVEEADKALLLGAATCFVYPSRYEGFGLPPLEAMACGTPVICADAGSVPEVVGNAGILVPAGDELKLADAMDEVMAEPAFRNDLSERGLERSASFTWERTARLTFEAYQAALSG